MQHIIFREKNDINHTLSTSVSFFEPCYLMYSPFPMLNFLSFINCLKLKLKYFGGIFYMTVA